VRGHGRLEAAKRLGLSKVPVDYQDYETDELERADRIADNRIAELSLTDIENLEAELDDLKSRSIGLDLMAFGADKTIDAAVTRSLEAEEKNTAVMYEDDGKLKAFLAARQKSKERGADSGEINFWLCLVFQSYKQKYEFLNQFKDMPTRYGMYIDGELFAKAVGRPVTPNAQKPFMYKIEKQLSEMVIS
jgi:hypothetical protein